MLVVFPCLNLLVGLITDPQIDFGRYDLVTFLIIPTLIMLWLMFLVIILAMWREQAGPASIGLGRIRVRHLPLAVLFLIASNLFLWGLEWLLVKMGLPVGQNIDELVAQASKSAGWWLAVSITAAICEEVIFRGYLLTRMKAVLGRGWLLPVFISTLAFATGHLYQGWGGGILLFVYGMLFCVLYITSGSLWPGILAHFIQDFSAIFIFRYYNG